MIDASGPSKKKAGGMSSNSVRYRVEARWLGSEPRQFGSQWLTKEWSIVSFSAAPPGFGVPTQPPYEPRTEFMTYEAAQALSWWMHAGDGLLGAICLETRLVAYDFEWNYAAYERGVSEVQSHPRRPFDDFAPREAEVSTDTLSPKADAQPSSEPTP